MCVFNEKTLARSLSVLGALGVQLVTLSVSSKHCVRGGLTRSLDFTDPGVRDSRMLNRTNPGAPGLEEGSSGHYKVLEYSSRFQQE